MISLPLDRMIPAPAVAKAADATLSALKNYVKRQSLLYPGPEPRAGHPRMMPVYGAYEFTVLIALQRAGLSLEAARAVWTKLMRNQFSAEREPGGEDDAPMTFNETMGNAANRWTPGANNQHPRTLPSFMSGDIANGEIVAISVRADRYGRSGEFRVSTRKLTPSFFANWRGDMADLFAVRRPDATAFPADPNELRECVLLFDFNRLIFNTNLRLLGAIDNDATTADDEADTSDA